MLLMWGFRYSWVQLFAFRLSSERALPKYFIPFFLLINKWESALCNTQIKLSCTSNYELGGNQQYLSSSLSTSSSVISVRKISLLLDSVTVSIASSISYLSWLKCYWCGFQILINAALRLSPVTWTRSATILLAHTTVLAILGTLVMEQHART